MTLVLDEEVPYDTVAAACRAASWRTPTASAAASRASTHDRTTWAARRNLPNPSTSKVPGSPSSTANAWVGAPENWQRSSAATPLCPFGDAIVIVGGSKFGPDGGALLADAHMWTP